MFHFNASNIHLQRYSFPQRIWKVRPDPFSDWVALELRNQKEKRAAFSMLDLGTAAVATLSPLLHQMDWWQGIEDFREGVALLHGYADFAVPVHLGLSARNALGDVLWEQASLHFEGMVAEGLVVTEPDGLGLKAQVIDLETGEVMQRHSGRLDVGLQAGIAAYERLRVVNLAFPEMVSVGDPRYADWCKRLDVTPFGALHLLIQQDVALLAWHEGTPAEGFALALAVFRGEELLLDGWLEENMTGMNPDPFFMIGQRLIAISEKKTLLVVEVRQPKA